MSKFKDKAIDEMNAKPKYEIAILQPDGPDDCEWTSYGWFEEYVKCIATATMLKEKGHEVKIFDPFMGITYDFPKDFGGA